MGSKYYRTLDDTIELKPLTVLDGKSKITKPVYIYFMLYEDNGSYRLPNATEDFLTAIGVEGIDKILSVNDSVCEDRILYDNFELNSLKKK